MLHEAANERAELCCASVGRRLTQAVPIGWHRRWITRAATF